MKKLLPLWFFLFGCTVAAQVGIGNTDPKSRLDISSSNPATPANDDGLLIPRIAVFPATNPTAAQNGMMVFLTAASGANQPGFYYWENASASWKPIGGNGNPGWALNGNTGTSPATNFIGTIDDKDLIFKRYNQKAGLLSLENTAFGNGSLPLATGLYNAALGSRSQSNTTSGSANTSVGTESMETNTDGLENAAIGYRALLSNSHGSFNTAVGSNALVSATGSNNTGIGNLAASNVTSGSNNIAIGMNAQVSSATGNNQLSVGNVIYGTNMDVTENGRIGIGLLAPSAKFQIASPSNPAAPTNTDGILIPRVSQLAPVASMTAAQNGMMVFLTTLWSGNASGFYYWDNPTTSWKAIGTGAADADFYKVGTSLPPTAITDDIYHSGNVGIGTVVPSDRLNVDGGNVRVGGIGTTWVSAANSRLVKFGDGDYVSLGEEVADDFLSFKARNFLFNPSGSYTGNVGIGVTAATEKLEVAGKTKTTNLQMTNGASAGRVLVSDAAGNGTWMVPGSATGGWATGGNAGTNSSINFVGTTDAQALILKSNNVQVGKIQGFGNYGTFLGYNAGINNSSIGNTAVGSSALATNSAGTFNVAVGQSAMVSNIGGNYNVAVGHFALSANTLGNFNTALGDRALTANTQGIANTSVGHQSLLRNTVGIGNVACGSDSQQFNTTGVYNASLGTNSLFNNDSGMRNSAVGTYSMQGVTSGSYNTAIGAYCYDSGDFSNSTAIGDASSVTASDQVRVGDVGVSSIGGFAGWTTVSDGRLKTDIAANVPGLDFIKKLRPVTYHLDMDAIADILKKPDSLRKPDSERSKAAQLQTGFIAQEVEAAASESGFDFSGVDKPKNDGDFYGLRYAEFVVPLVKAVQEQQQIIDHEKAKNELLQKEMQQMKREFEARLNAIEAKLK